MACSARGVHSLCKAKLREHQKSPKERRPHCQRPVATAPGNLRCSPHGGMPQTRCAQTCVLLIPVGLRSSALCRGGPRGAGSARLRRASRRSRAGGPVGGCEICSAIGWRVDPISCPGHEGALCAPDPALGSPSVCAEERSFKWTRARDCLSRRVRAEPHLERAPQVPVALAEGADNWGAFLLVPFLLRKRKLLRRRAHIPTDDRRGTPPAMQLVAANAH